MLRSPYFRRLFVPYLLLILGGTLAAGFWGATRIKTLYLERTESLLHNEARLVAQLLGAEWDTERLRDLQTRTRHLGSELGRRISILSADGTVLADSAHDPATLLNEMDRPEVRAAVKQGHGVEVRRSSTQPEDMMYLALRMGEGGQSNGFVRLAISLRDLQVGIRALYVQLAIGALCAFVISGAICYIIARRTTAPILELAVAANTLAEGSFQQRIVTDDTSETGVLANALNHLADSLGKMIEKTAKDEEELRAVLGSMVEGVIAVDHRGIIKVVNRAAARFFDFSLDGAKGKPLKEILHHEQVRALVDQVSENHQILRKRIGPTAGALDLDVVVCPVRTPREEGGAVIIAHDIAESERYQELRNEFVANVSHELRTPLACIKGFVEALADGAVRDPARRDRFLQRIQSNVEQLSNLVGDLLELSRQQERTEPRRERLEIVELLSRECEAFLPFAENKNQKLGFEKPVSAAHVMGNARDLEHAFANLLDNAIKYTDPGGWISVSLSIQDPHVVVSVEDTGIGIPENELPRIFERFYRVDKSRSREMGGTGLGLSIVKHVIQAHGGTISVSSHPDRGSKFEIVLPLAKPIAPKPANTTEVEVT